MDTEFQGLIPDVAEMQRVGPIFDADTYIKSGRLALQNLRRFAYLRPSSNVMDIGCGFGRVAIHLAQFLEPGAQGPGDSRLSEKRWNGVNRTSPQSSKISGSPMFM